jgi:co-chaperonin GroES (HSP10)
MVTTRSPLDGALTNDQWVTQEDIPDPTPLPRIPGVGILVRPVPIRRKTAGGILLPDTFREDREYLNTVGRVLALGELSFIVYAKLTGQKIWWKGVKLLLIKPSNIELVVEQPEYLDANFKE